VESPSMAEVGPPVILSLGIAGYCSVMRPWPQRRDIVGILTVPCCGSTGTPTRRS
jgi:hypothetical protein